MPLASPSFEPFGNSVSWCHWHWYQHHGMQTASSMKPIHYIGQDDQNEVLCNFLCHMIPLALASYGGSGIINRITAFLRSKHLKWGAMLLLAMWHHWCQHQCHVTAMTLSIAPLHSSGHYDWNEVKLAFLSCDAIGISVGVKWWQWHHQWNHCILYIKTIEIRFNITLWPCDINGIVSVMWLWWHYQWHHCIPQVKMIAILCDMSFLVRWCHWHQLKASHDANGVINVTTAFLKSRLCKWGATWQLLLSYDNIGIDVSTMWHQCHHQWHQYSPWVKVIKMSCYVTY